MDAFPNPGGRREPPRRPPLTAAALGGPDDEPNFDHLRKIVAAQAREHGIRKLRLEALAAAEDLMKAGKRIAAGLKARPDAAAEYRELYREWLRLVRKALTVAGAQ